MTLIFREVATFGGGGMVVTFRDSGCYFRGEVSLLSDTKICVVKVKK